MVISLTELVKTYPENVALINTWVDGVFPLILDVEAKAAEKELEKFTSICSGLLVWLSEVEQRLDGVRESREGREAILRELEERRGEVDLANKLAAPLRKVGALQPLEASLASCNFRWDQVGT